MKDIYLYLVKVIIQYGAEDINTFVEAVNEQHLMENIDQCAVEGIDQHVVKDNDQFVADDNIIRHKLIVIWYILYTSIS